MSAPKRALRFDPKVRLGCLILSSIIALILYLHLQLFSPHHGSLVHSRATRAQMSAEGCPGLVISGGVGELNDQMLSPALGDLWFPLDIISALKSS
jgi:hypothetical protein